MGLHHITVETLIFHIIVNSHHYLLIQNKTYTSYLYLSYYQCFVLLPFKFRSSENQNMF